MDRPYGDMDICKPLPANLRMWTAKQRTEKLLILRMAVACVKTLIKTFKWNCRFKSNNS